MFDTFWFGDEMSFKGAALAIDNIHAALSAGTLVPSGEDEEDLPPLLTKQDGIGIVAVKGPLTNYDSPWNAFFGITSYNDIRAALIAAAHDAEIQHILLDVNSPGGAVNGLSDVANLIQTIHRDVKPVTAYTDGAMMSAAYWLGSSAGEVYASEVAQVGSIGVIATHMERSKQLAEAGIGVTVMRAGKYKALVNSVEPLTEAAKTQLQESLDEAYRLFVSHVAQMRGVSYEEADQNMAQGREFFGRRALAAGLVDGIESFDGLMSKLRAQMLDKQGKMGLNPSQTSKVTEMTRKALTEQQIAALAEGAALEAAATAEVTEQETGEQNEAVEAAASTETAPTEKAPTETASTADAGVVALLQSQLEAANAQVVDLKVELKGMKEKSADMEASFAGLLEIARTSCNRMQVALGGTALNLEALSAAAVLEQHKVLSEQFQAKFKAGGIAAVDATQTLKSETPVQTNVAAARFAAVRFSN